MADARNVFEAVGCTVVLQLVPACQFMEALSQPDGLRLGFGMWLEAAALLSGGWQGTPGQASARCMIGSCPPHTIAMVSGWRG